MKKRSHSRLKYITIKRNKLSVKMLHKTRGQVCAHVKDVERAGESKPKHLCFISSSRIWAEEGAGSGARRWLLWHRGCLLQGHRC